jgi:hypothetical protein
MGCLDAAPVVRPGEAVTSYVVPVPLPIDAASVVTQ